MTNNADIDEARLQSDLSDQLDTDIVGVDILSRFPNLVISLGTTQDETAYILRTPSPIKDSTLMAGLREEYELLDRLAETLVPTPTPVLFSEDTSVIGDQYYVRRHLDGVAPGVAEDLDPQYRNPTAREAVAEGMMDTLAQIHRLDVGRFEDVCETLTPTERVRRARTRLARAREVTAREDPRLREVGDWLLANAPPSSPTALVHGDYKPDHVLFSGTDPPEVSAVIDWEIATLSDPLIDLGYFLLFWRDPGDPTPSIEEIEEAYPDSSLPEFLKKTNDDGFFPFTTDPGSPSRQEIVSIYEEQTNQQFENERFYRALAAFSIATYWEFCHKESVESGGDSPWEPRIEYMIALGTSIVGGSLEL